MLLNILLFHNILFTLVPPLSVALNGPTTEVANGSTTQLTCTASSSNPAVTLTWKHNRAVFANTWSYSYVAGSNYGTVTSQTLVITPTRNMNGDTFSCSANNSATTATVDSNVITLDVRCKLVKMKILNFPIGELNVLFIRNCCLY